MMKVEARRNFYAKFITKHALLLLEVSMLGLESSPSSPRERWFLPNARLLMQQVLPLSRLAPDLRRTRIIP
jgi:hypothetical protein